MSFVSQRAKLLGESATLKMARLAGELKEQGKDVISLSLGEPDFFTPDYIKEAAKNAIDENHSFYTPVAGTKSLREAIQKKLDRDNNISVGLDQIIVSTGAKQSLMNLILATINPGDEVILPAPYWVSYIEMVKFSGGVPIVIETSIEDDFKVTAEKLKLAISEKTKMFLFSNPCNPSGSSYSKDELALLANIFENYEDILIVSDEIYEHINFNQKNVSMANFEKLESRVVTVNGVSKGFAMTGWRVGFLAGPASVVKACSKIQGQFTSGANAIAQQAAQKALEESPEKVSFMKEAFLKRRDVFFDELSKIAQIKVNKPGGAFYIFPDVSNVFGKKYKGELITDSFKLSELLLKEALVATTPGAAFGSPNNIRLSYALSEDVLKEAAKRLMIFFSALN